MIINMPATHLPDGFDERQKAMDDMLDLLQKNKICAACAGSAALYVAAMSAQSGMNVQLPEFLEMAETIFKDAAQQLKDRTTDN